MSDAVEPIAVIGAAGRFPGAPNLDEFWANLATGRETLSALSDDALLAAGVDPALVADPAYVKRAGLMPDVDMFDAPFFGMTQRDAEIYDPQLRLFLETTHQAIEDAGYDPLAMAGDVAVYGACGPSLYGERNVRADPTVGSALDMRIMVGNNVDYLTTFASYKLDLRGPSMAVLTACSSSLTAVHLACRALQFGDCDAAVAGATNVEEVPHPLGYRWSPGDVRSADGRCRPFDASGTGTIFTSGAGAVLLKRLGDAVADGDDIRGVIHGIGITNDGRDKVSFSAPSVSGQSTAIIDAMASAGFLPGDIGCVEMHATGTPLGDPIEMSALAEAYRLLADGPLAPGRIPVGSVKGNIGHTVPVAGLAGLLKLLLALQHEQIPPTIGVAAPNPALELHTTPFFLNDALRPWRRTAGAPRRAGLSSLGIGGTNVHLVLEEGPVPAPTPHRGRPRVVVWSGRDAAAADANRSRLAGHLAGLHPESFAGAVATLQSGRTPHPVRSAVVCADPAEAAAALADGPAIGGGAPLPAEPPPVVLAFPGQGSQYPRMAAQLYGVLPEFTETIDECLELLGDARCDLYELWLDPDPGAALEATVHAQPLLFAVEYALAAQLREWGIRPSAVIGHSVGELVAATVAGVLALPDALRLVALRGRFMQDCPPGAMLAAAAGIERLAPVLDGTPVAVAAVNAADQTVLSGPHAVIDVLAASLAAAGIEHRRLRTSHAFHSPDMTPAVERFHAAFAGIALAEPTIRLHSAGSGTLLTPEQARDPWFWARQIAEPVRFGAALDDLHRLAPAPPVVVEVGPGTALTRLAARHGEARGHAVATLKPRRGRAVDEHRDVLTALADLWTRGVPVTWSALDRDERPHRVALPGYSFQRTRCWVDPPARTAPPPVATPALTAAAAPADGDPPFTVPAWVEAPRPAPDAPAGGHALVVEPADPAAATVVATAVEQAGYAVHPVTHPAQLTEVVARLGREGHRPRLLVHARGAGGPSAGAPADELDELFGLLVDLVQSAGRQPVDGGLPGLLVVTTGAVDVSGCELLQPGRAGLVAAARTYRLETPEARCQVVDIAGVAAPDLAAELACAAPEPVVALRRSRRWLPVQRPWAPQPWAPQAGTRADARGGVTLVTGGLGGLGLALAKGLAARGAPGAIALMSRTGSVPPTDLAELERHGARVHVVHCDVTDRVALGAALDEITTTLGPIGAIYHLAGIAGDGMLQFRDREQAGRVLRPKTHGTAALAEVLAHRPPVGLVACFSSRAALTGMVGGADYSAANAFLDAFAAGRPGWLSIDWPGWAGVGMARGGVLTALSAKVREARRPARPDGVLHHDEVIAAATHWELDEHRIGGVAVLPGTAVAELVLRAYLMVVPGATAPVTLRDVTFLRPVVGDAPQRVQVRFEPDGAGQWQVRVLVRPEPGAATSLGRDPDWVEHASAVAVAGGPPARTVDVAGLTAGLTETRPPSLRPAPGDPFVFGPRWHNIRRTWEDDDTIVARLALAPGFATEAVRRPLHPALLDTGSGILRRRSPGRLVVPATYRSLTWYQPIPSGALSRVRLRTTELAADVEVVTPDGQVAVAIDGLHMRPVTTAAFTPAGAAPAAEDTDGLAPGHGVELLLQLLDGGAPPQVAVLPHHGTTPVGGGTTPVGAGTGPIGEETAAPDRTPSAPAPERPSDADSVEDEIAAMWRQILGREKIRASDDFFELGGDSLMGVALTGRIRDAFGVHLSIGSLFDYPDLRSLAAAVRELAGA